MKEYNEYSSQLGRNVAMLPFLDGTAHILLLMKSPLVYLHKLSVRRKPWKRSVVCFSYVHSEFYSVTFLGTNYHRVVYLSSQLIETCSTEMDVIIIIIVIISCGSGTSQTAGLCMMQPVVVFSQRSTNSPRLCPH